jgi:hypothetical protein
MGGRGKKSAVVKVGHRTGGKASASKKRKSAISMANAAGLRAVQALEARRRGSGDTEEETDELQREGEEEGDEEEEEGEESAEIEEQESQEAETQMEPQIRKRKRSKVLNVSLPLHPSICPDVIRESARSAGQILKWVDSGIFKTKPMLPTSSESFCHGSLLNTDWHLSPLHFLLCNK